MRLLLNIVVLASALFLPFVVTLLLLAFGALYFPRYVESVAFALLLELLYRGGEDGVWSAAGLLTLTVFAAFIAVETLRMFIRTQPR
ncbi:MAG: hypothetical protein A3C93_06430 [Candidatus Lloydbacteria bacterium RIFCSPHIGHO2_02_FULL_54_17]|uniref:Uncharacterized protein n=1 Tax=Candidatus Lloydbacteria bacterium RIFCSPHIGHO2_02_FULL_54_17 TaxID=1798664 RepID=A0A1G2DGS4_9BACT|nr:MAG: hypothetical protein A2762_01415 [Candidatus Lloydbacteria bacterium RIFCSPHIGHO2_01_FULL_54_11]OGZ12713.1 MAG: hypothetical protein A3C93_06430 [Candidatus Lloydbacteria bacterium RIFCSPHIGHO2_02_FULL_54_17]OGZ13564.1 MAG: hypothetical protein A2948_05090 [Candidatus Lloydbacteria bacterium RIFCSPLOWO2_01_FULL_54_18]OGZ16232.1 MAG: hypothetical protein A3H76_03920 [Candidatus Lloydbacteria bacterium RIFCSPLOWO2_02_FULL_54_12]